MKTILMYKINSYLFISVHSLLYILQKFVELKIQIFNVAEKRKNCGTTLQYHFTPCHL